MLLTSFAANESAAMVKLDGKTVFIPEIKLTRKVNPVTSFLYIGSWEGSPRAGMAQQSLCVIDPENKNIRIKFPERLLENSRPALVARKDADSFLNVMSWEGRQSTQLAFNVISDRRRPVVIEMYADSKASLFHNGKLAGNVPVGDIRDAGGLKYIPVMLEIGENIINIKQFSVRAKPRIQVAVRLDNLHNLQAAWQPQNGLLKNLVCMPGERGAIPSLDWSSNLGNFSVSLEVRDVSTGNIVFRKISARRGRLIGVEAENLPLGVYEAAYRTPCENASEIFIVGNPNDLYAELQDSLSKYDTEYNTEISTKLAIEAQLCRAQILLNKDNYAAWDRKWQEKIAYTLGSLAVFKRRLEEGVMKITKDQPGLHIRGFTSNVDNSLQSYRLFVPSNYNPTTPLPLLVIVSARIANKSRSFIEGPTIANHREALLWAQYGEKYGFAILWPGYRSIPEGYSYESKHIDEAIQAVEQDYKIAKGRISIYASCGAGYSAGRLVSEYPNRFAAIVYDRAVFNLTSPNKEPPVSTVEWLKVIDPVRHVIDNPNLKIFVMHDNTTGPGHGPLDLTTQFLEQANKIRGDVISYLVNQPMGVARMDRVFSWIAPCSNAYPDDMRTSVAAKAGYAGPISEIFNTPIIVVEGTRSIGRDLQNIHDVAKSIRSSYIKRFHGAECIVKKDVDMTQDDINNHSLILIGNPRSNNIWAQLQDQIPLKVTLESVAYKNDPLTGNQAFEAIVKHPYAMDKYVLMIGSTNLKSLRQISPTTNLFNAWYDCCVFGSTHVTIGKLDDMPNTTSSQTPVKRINPRQAKSKQSKSQNPANK